MKHIQSTYIVLGMIVSAQYILAALSGLGLYWYLKVDLE